MRSIRKLIVLLVAAIMTLAALACINERQVRDPSRPLPATAWWELS